MYSLKLIESLDTILIELSQCKIRKKKAVCKKSAFLFFSNFQNYSTAINPKALELSSISAKTA
jgi:hypothetical protein